MGRDFNNSDSSIQAAGGGPLAIASDGTYHYERIITLACEINEATIAMAMTQLMSFAQQDSSTPVNVIVNTYGGAVDEMFAFYDMMKLVQCPVHTVGLGKIMSAGVLLLSAGEKPHRIIGKHTRLMIHPVSSFIRGNVFQAVNEADELKRIQAQLEECLLKETKMTKSALASLMTRGNDVYITAEEAVQYGIVDKII